VKVFVTWLSCTHQEDIHNAPQENQYFHQPFFTGWKSHRTSGELFQKLVIKILTQKKLLIKEIILHLAIFSKL